MIIELPSTFVSPTIDPCAPEEDDTNLSSVSLDSSQVMSRASSRKSVDYDSMFVHILWLHISHASILRFPRHQSLDPTTDCFMFPTVNWLHGLRYPPGPPLCARRIAASRLSAYGYRLAPSIVLRHRAQVSRGFKLPSVWFTPFDIDPSLPQACPIVLRVRSTTPLHQSSPTRVFRHYRPISPP